MMLRSIGKHPCQACSVVNCVDIRRRDRADIVRAGRRLRRGRHAHSGRGGDRASYHLSTLAHTEGRQRYVTGRC